MKLLEQLRSEIRVRHYSIRTEKAYCHWVTRYVHFHALRHPCELSESHIGQFLSDLAVNGHVSASTQNQALCALVFLYRRVLKRDMAQFTDLVWAKRPETLPTVPEKASFFR